MAIERIATVTHYQGTQADLDELTDTDDYPLGATYHAFDIGDEFVKVTGGWVLDQRRARAIKRAEQL